VTWEDTFKEEEKDIEEHVERAGDLIVRLF